MAVRSPSIVSIELQGFNEPSRSVLANLSDGRELSLETEKGSVAISWSVSRHVRNIAERLGSLAGFGVQAFHHGKLRDLGTSGSQLTEWLMHHPGTQLVRMQRDQEKVVWLAEAEDPLGATLSVEAVTQDTVIDLAQQLACPLVDELVSIAEIPQELGLVGS